MPRRAVVEESVSVLERMPRRAIVEESVSVLDWRARDDTFWTGRSLLKGVMMACGQLILRCNCLEQSIEMWSSDVK